MSSLNIPPSQQYLMPRDADAIGPQNAAELRLYDLVLEGMESEPSHETSIAELTTELRARIRNKR